MFFVRLIHRPQHARTNYHVLKDLASKHLKLAMDCLDYSCEKRGNQVVKMAPNRPQSVVEASKERKQENKPLNH
jgi:hypothetical protein